MKLIQRYAPLLFLALLPACVTHSRSSEFNGVNGQRGVPIEYQSTTSYAINGLFLFPLLGNAKMSNTIDEFTKEAAANGATRTRFAQTSSLSLWFILPPLTFFLTPVITTVEGDIETVEMP